MDGRGEHRRGGVGKPLGVAGSMPREEVGSVGGMQDVGVGRVLVGGDVGGLPHMGREHGACLAGYRMGGVGMAQEGGDSGGGTGRGALPPLLPLQVALQHLRQQVAQQHLRQSQLRWLQLLMAFLGLRGAGKGVGGWVERQTLGAGMGAGEEDGSGGMEGDMEGGMGSSGGVGAEDAPEPSGGVGKGVGMGTGVGESLQDHAASNWVEHSADGVTGTE